MFVGICKDIYPIGIVRRVVENIVRPVSSCKITEENQFELLAEAVTPLWKTEYTKQLQIKQHWCRSVLKKLNKIKPSKVHEIVPSPCTTEYRNKDEFNIRNGIDGNPKTIGFFVGSHEEQNVVCVPPTGLNNIKKEHVALAQVYQEFIRKSPLPACHDLHDGGYWRHLLVRSNSKGESIATVIVHPRGASGEVVDETKKDLGNHFRSSDVKLKCLYFQLCPHTRCSGESYPFEVLDGEPYIFEELSGKQFRISPDSFFQTNTQLAQLMFDTVLRLLDLRSSTTLLDLCCGIGTISILASESVRGCIGIELSSEAVKDAIYNVNHNRITNCRFINGRIEEKMPLVLRDLEISSDVAAVLNPGRAGVGRTAITALRKCFQLNRLVYISCKADNYQTKQNFQHLCSPNFDNSPPFTLADVQAFDMFPQTNHCEVVLLFKR